MRNTGKPFERLIETVSNEYERKRILMLRKVDPPTTVIRGRVVYLNNPFVDWCGVWIERGARAIHAEAKSTCEPVLGIGHSSGVNERQVNNLVQWDAAGAAAFVLWLYADRVKVLPIRWLLDHTQRSGRKSIPWEDAGGECRQGKGFVLWDYVEIMRLIWPSK